MSKFNDAIDEWVYQQSADEEEGSSSEGAGYYARYDAPLMSDAEESELEAADVALLRDVKAGAILFEQTNGFVEVEYYDDEVEFESAWQAVVDAQ